MSLFLGDAVLKAESAGRPAPAEAIRVHSASAHERHAGPNAAIATGRAVSGQRGGFADAANDWREVDLDALALRSVAAFPWHPRVNNDLTHICGAQWERIEQALRAIFGSTAASGHLLPLAENLVELMWAERDVTGRILKPCLRALLAGILPWQSAERLVLRGESERRIESVAKLVEEAAALALVGAREQSVQLRFALEPACDRVVADRVQIQQVLVNLLRNAMEAMAESPRRELAVSSGSVADGMVEIAVADTGQGLPEAVRAKLFQPFFTTKEAGMGVGLSISRTIVEAHGGKLSAEANPAGGATFRLTLPTAA